MSLKIHNPKILVLCLLTIATFTLSACAKLVHSQELSFDEIEQESTEEIIIETEEVNDEIAEETLDFITYEQAREIAIAYLREKYTLDAPNEWMVQDQTSENLVGASNFLYTSGAWVVSMSAPVVAQQHLVYSIEIDHISSGLRWEGKVDASGTVFETSVSEPLQVLSVEDARDVAADFIKEKYQWADLTSWNDNGQEPIENAGVRYTFTSGPWVIQVEHLAAAPIVPEYRIIADHITLCTRWSGIIKATGEVIEEEYTKN